MSIEVVGRHEGVEVARFTLEHGRDVRAGLLARGWGGRPAAVVRPSPDMLVISYDVLPADPVEELVALTVPPDPGLTEADIAAAHRHQRLAAYAVVRSHRGVLLTQLSARTNVPGQWNLPGGGIEPHEDPLEGLVREVHEETGQVVEDLRLLTVLTRHWVGRAPSGRVEDFHAVRLFHTAVCPAPTDPVVHDVGGSTEQARWVHPEDLAAMRLASSVPDALEAAGVIHG